MVAGRLVTGYYGTLPYHSYQRLTILPNDRGQRDNACFSENPRRTATTTTTPTPTTPDNE